MEDTEEAVGMEVEVVDTEEAVDMEDEVVDTEEVVGMEGLQKEGLGVMRLRSPATRRVMTRGKAGRNTEREDLQRATESETNSVREERRAKECGKA